MTVYVVVKAVAVVWWCLCLEVPIAGRRLWSIFLDLNATRSAGMAANPISYAEIEAYSGLRRGPVRGLSWICCGPWIGRIRRRRERSSTNRTSRW